MSKEDSREELLVELTRDGVSVKDRTIRIPSIDISAPLTLGEFMSHIIHLSDDDKKYDPINIIISTFGGDSYGMLGMIDIIRTAPVKINTIGVGAIFSAGFFILASGTGVRKMYKNSFAMVHQLRGMNDGSLMELQQNTNHIVKIQNIAEQLLEKFSNKDQKYWSEVCRGEFYLDAEETKNLGIVDEVIPWENH